MKLLNVYTNILCYIIYITLRFDQQTSIDIFVPIYKTL